MNKIGKEIIEKVGKENKWLKKEIMNKMAKDRKVMKENMIWTVIKDTSWIEWMNKGEMEDGMDGNQRCLDKRGVDIGELRKESKENRGGKEKNNVKEEQ